MHALIHSYVVSTNLSSYSKWNVQHVQCIPFYRFYVSLCRAYRGEQSQKARNAIGSGTSRRVYVRERNKWFSSNRSGVDKKRSKILFLPWRLGSDWSVERTKT